MAQPPFTPLPPQMQHPRRNGVVQSISQGSDGHPRFCWGSGDIRGFLPGLGIHPRIFAVARTTFEKKCQGSNEPAPESAGPYDRTASVPVPVPQCRYLCLSAGTCQVYRFDQTPGPRAEKVWGVPQPSSASDAASEAEPNVPQRWDLSFPGLKTLKNPQTPTLGNVGFRLGCCIRGGTALGNSPYFLRSWSWGLFETVYWNLDPSPGKNLGCHPRRKGGFPDLPGGLRKPPFRLGCCIRGGTGLRNSPSSFRSWSLGRRGDVVFVSRGGR